MNKNTFIIEDNSLEIKLLNIQMIASLIFIGTITVNLLLSYNERLRLENKPPLFSNKCQSELSLYNKIIAFILVLTYFGIDIKNVEVANQKNKDTTVLKRDILPAFLAIITSSIILYNAKKNTTNGISEVENPTL